MTITAINPWHDAARISNSKPVLAYEGNRLLSYRGVEVYKNPAGSWDYIYEGMAITQRAGFSAKNGKPLIDDLLLGLSVTMCDTVREHIASHQNMAV